MAERTTTCRFHCRACGRHFTSERAFAWHRTGPIEARTCIDPAKDKRKRFSRKDGECGILSLGPPVAGKVWSV